MGGFAVIFQGMPWKICSAVGERLRFVKMALKAQKPLAQLCRAFGISRQNGYKWIARFEQGGRRALGNGSCRPKRSPRKTPRLWIERIRRLRRRHARWGAKKIRAKLRRKYPRATLPAVRTIGLWLRRLKLVKGRRRPRPPEGSVVVRRPLTEPAHPNDVWTVDFKGWFRTQDGKRVDPLTVRDLFSRYILIVWLLADLRWEPVQAVFVRLFVLYGLPKVIRVDNGGPFASTGPAGLSRLSAWWTALGIRVEFIRPGHPEENGAHEQMHRVFKLELLHRPSSTLRAQQRRVHRWVCQYNYERPHEGLGQRVPRELYRASQRSYASTRLDMKYNRGWNARRVRSNGQIKWQSRLRFVGEAFVGFRIGLKPIRNGIHEVYFRNILLGELHASDSGGLRPSAYVRQSPTTPSPEL